MEPEGISFVLKLRIVEPKIPVIDLEIKTTLFS